MNAKSFKRDDGEEDGGYLEETIIEPLPWFLPESGIRFPSHDSPGGYSKKVCLSKIRAKHAFMHYSRNVSMVAVAECKACIKPHNKTYLSPNVVLMKNVLLLMPIIMHGKEGGWIPTSLHPLPPLER